MVYKHHMVKVIANLIERYGGGGRDPIMRAVWFGIKGQVPEILRTLDNNEKLIEELRGNIMEALELDKPVVPVEVKQEPIMLAEAAPEVKQEGEPVALVEVEAEVREVKPKRGKAKKVVEEEEVVVEPEDNSGNKEH